MAALSQEANEYSKQMDPMHSIVRFFYRNEPSEVDYMDMKNPKASYKLGKERWEKTLKDASKELGFDSFEQMKTVFDDLNTKSVEKEEAIANLRHELDTHPEKAPSQENPTGFD